MKRNINSLLIATLLAVIKAEVDEFCGYAPLCGSPEETFDWQEGAVSSSTEGSVLLGAELVLEDCCKLIDTQPIEECQIVDPNGEHFRVLSASEELCGTLGEDCLEGDCSEYQLVIKPSFLKPQTNEKCCNSCTCFGDPQCISFSGEEKMWALCDGRDVPHEDSIWEMCRITRSQCLQEIDHAGNDCVYLSNDTRGRDWTVGKQGSPCVPNPLSPPSVITMYEVDSAQFSLRVEQGERGIIKKVLLNIECGEFVLTAENCVNLGSAAWQSSIGYLPEFFAYQDVVHGYDELWTIVDNFSGISISIRCHANRFEGDPEAYVPRINVEDVSDPLEREAAEGFCVSGEFDYGMATTANTDNIFANELCDEGLQDSKLREIFRAMCRNPGLPQSAHKSCIYHFCDQYYLPLFSSIEECEDTFDVSLAEGFCKGVTYNLFDSSVCVDKWFDLGAVETIQEYYDNEQGCTNELQQSLSTCQSGLILQYYRNDQWNDEIAIPADFCSDEDIVISKCDHKYLFNRPMRVLQKTAASKCGPQTVCTTVEGFVGTFELVKRTPYPTAFPTKEPTVSPTNFPTPFPISPTNFPTPFPNIVPTDTAPPSICPDSLCGTDNEDVLFEDDEIFFEMEECCVEERSPCEEVRTQTSSQWYCGLSDGENGTVADSVAGIPCDDFNEITVSVSFSHEEECCLKCTCFGDPRCYSFSGHFEEFILCDGRDPTPDPSERCIIRRDTCFDQTDHLGNTCLWTNPLSPVPDFLDPVEQEEAERQFQVARFGSPCRSSELSTILLYAVEEFRVEVEQGERGYIQVVHLTTSSGEFRMDAERCLDGLDWELMSGLGADVEFERKKYGKEYLWTIVDLVTDIKMEVRCTGHVYEGSLTTMFMNVEGIFEWNEDRLRQSDGFCANDLMPEKELASTSHTDFITSGGLCDNWNEDVSDIVKREVARIITNNPGVTLVGTESAYKAFCKKFFSPGWSSVGNCVNGFMNANTIKQLIKKFCRAVTNERNICEENLEVLADASGYKAAFREGYETYVVSFETECELKFGDLPPELVFNEDECGTGVELQFWNPRKLEWITYAAFPDQVGGCSTYEVKALYKYHPKLFKNRLRLLQRYNSQFCHVCQQVSEVRAVISYSPEPEGSF